MVPVLDVRPQDKLRTIYIETSKVLYTFFEKEINEGNYAFTAEEDRLFYNFYKMIGYTRSIKYGLGQRDQTYAMIMAWWNYYPECAYDAIKHMVCESSFGFGVTLNIFAILLINTGANLILIIVVITTTVNIILIRIVHTH